MDIYAQFVPESQKALTGEDVADGRFSRVKTYYNGEYWQYRSAAAIGDGELSCWH